MKEVIKQSNDTDKIKTIIEFWLQGSGLGGADSRSRDRCSDEPSLKELQLTDKLIIVTATTEVDTVVKGAKRWGVWRRGGHEDCG